MLRPRRHRSRLVLLALCVGAVVAQAAVGAADELDVPTCLDVTKSAPYRGYGYQHIVHLRSQCEEELRCRVSTDVTPAEQPVNLAPGERQDVVTRVGSPSSVFQANVRCED